MTSDKNIVFATPPHSKSLSKSTRVHYYIEVMQEKATRKIEKHL